jgi:hypothetical protein
MAEGDLVVADDQYEYAGLLMGSGTQYMVEKWDGLFDIKVSSSDIPRGDNHGSFPGLDLMPSRDLVGSIKVLGNGKADTVSRVVDLATAFRPKRNEIRFTYRKSGLSKRFILARSRKMSVPSDYEMAHGIASADVMLTATDPRHYGATLRYQEATIQPGQTGVQLPTINNVGNWYTAPVLFLTGASNNLSLSVGGQTPILGDDFTYNGQSTVFNVSMTGGQELWADFRTGSITLNGGAADGLKAPYSPWWELLPGNNTVVANRSPVNSGGPCTVRVYWYDAWVY